MRVLAGVIAGALLGAAIVRAPTHAQPAPQPDIERAKELYLAARQALEEGRHADAIRDFGASYDVTKDPVMFYWIGSANERAGKCDVALIYYGRYLKEGKPSPQFLETVQQRIAACGGGAGSGSAAPEPGSGSGSAVEQGRGSAVEQGGGSAAEPRDTSALQGAGPSPTEGSAAGAAPLRAKHQGPWLMVGGSIALLTIGAVLAYSADAAENDISDLYVGLEGNPPVFDARTQKRYDDLIAEGERYERLSWVSFALAGGLAAGAAVWFYLSRDEGQLPPVTPTLGNGEVGVTTRIRW